MMLRVIVVATSRGTPKWRSMKPRMTGPSLSRKKVLKAEKVRKKNNEVSPSIPFCTPSSSVLPLVEAPLFAPSVALEVPPAPRSFAQPSIVSAACESDDLISSDCS